MKIKKNFMLRKVSDSYVVVPIGSASADFNGMINLNEAGAFLWRQMEEETTFNKVLEAMLEMYEVEEDVAKADLQEFIDNLIESGLLD